AIRRIAVMHVALACLGRTRGVGEVLVEVLDQVTAPDEVTAEVAMRERDHIAFLVGEERERNDQALVALAARDCPLDESLAKQIEDPIVAGAGEVHPRINAEEGCGRFTFDLLGTQGALAEDRRKVGKSHVEAATLCGVAGAGKPREVNGGGAASRGGAGCLPAGISDARAVRGCGATDPGGRGSAFSGSTAADRRCDNPREGGGRIRGRRRAEVRNPERLRAAAPQGLRTMP